MPEVEEAIRFSVTFGWAAKVPENESQEFHIPLLGRLTQPQLASFFRNSCSSRRYLKALRPSMKTTGTSSVNWRLRLSSVSTSTSRQRKPPRRSSFLSFSFTISQRWHPLREYTMTSRSRDMGGSLASRMGFFHSYLFVSGQFFDCTEPDWDARYNPFHGGTGFQTAGRKGCSGNRRG